ncbi:MAG: phosphodiesterase [Isosphaeraceae bacterium]|nr:MAG: phosphodiesterase [Isosphaeraceae bacterium]
MKILILGLDCAAPELLLGSDDLPHIRHLMAAGGYGRLESVVPPITVPAWMCMATSQDPGSLGVYGFRNRADYSYDKLSIATSRSITEIALWDQLAREGKRSICVGIPPGYPPRKINGLWVGCFMTPDTSKDVFTHPADWSARVNALAGGTYPVDVKGFRTDDKAWLRDQIFDMSRRQWAVVRHLMTSEPWDYLHFVDIGLDRIHHGFWKYHDPHHVQHVPGSPFQSAIRDYYRHLDAEIGQTLEQLDDETIVLVVSDHGARALDGGFCVNEWLIDQGDLVLHEYPSKPTPFAQLSVDWSRTKAWSEGGYYARVFLNIEGREPQGTLAKADVLRYRDDLKARLEATTNPDGQPLGTLVFKPEELYRHLRNVPPDLIVHFGALAWRSIGSVGYGRGTYHVQENDTGPDDCNHAQFGAFVLASPRCPLAGEVHGARLLDIAPTLLELAGCDIPPSMQGRSLVSGLPASPPPDLDDNQVIRDRLSGLGYIA